MRRAVIFTVCVFAIGMPGQPNKAPAAAQNQTQTQTPSTTLNLENCNVTSTQPDTANNSAPDWNTAIKRAVKTPDGWLVIVAFLTGCAIWYQAREMARATEEMKKSTTAAEKSAATMEKSVNLQKIAMQQWIRVDDWRVEGTDVYKKHIPSTLTIAVDIDNPTDFLLTIEDVSANVAGIPWKSTIRNVLAPNDPAVKIEFPVKMLPQWGDDYRQNRLEVTVIGSIGYLDCFGKRQEQPMGEAFVLGMQYWNHGSIGLKEDDRTTQGEEKAN
ncbi:MAG: hypothetical protein ABSD63_00640 [Candidatus Korobacteraceae bacterium]